MTPPAFRARLRALGLGPTAFARVVERLSGEPQQLRTVQTWVSKREPPSSVVALLALMERHPESWLEMDHLQYRKMVSDGI